METSLELRLRHQPDALKFLLNDLSEEQILSKPLPGKWSVFENIAHLGRLHETYLQRIQQLQSENNPILNRYVAEEDDGFINWCSKGYLQVMNDFMVSREKLNEYLFSLNDEQLQRTAQHTTYGVMNVSDWAEFFLLHEAHHFFAIFKLSRINL